LPHVGNDRSGFTAFPPFQTQHATFTALRFPGRFQYSRRADSWLSTGRRTSRTSLPSSAFLPSSIYSAFQERPLADLHLVRPITGQHLATTPPPPSLPRAGILASPRGVKRCESSPVSDEEVLATRSCVFSAGRTKEQSLRDDGTPRTAAVPFWFGCVSRFTRLDVRHVARFCCAEALVVSIGCRGSPVARSARPSGYIVSGLPTPGSATPWRRPLTPRAIAHARFFMNNSFAR
jgi:hypothetical protein